MTRSRIKYFIVPLCLTAIVLLARPVAPRNPGAGVSPSASPPRRVPEQLIVAAYNVRHLGEKRKDLDALARVIRNFDICGLVEVRNKKTLALLAKRLRSITRRPWGFIFGQDTHRPGGKYKEAFGVIWRRDRAQLGDGLIGNIRDRAEKFRHAPFIASFRRGNFDFMLILIHTRWTNDAEGTRKGEVLAAADLINRLRKRYAERDFLLMGDFNYSGRSRHMREMARRADLLQLDPGAPTTFKAAYTGYANSYDHIYASRNTAQREFVPGLSQVLDTTRYLYGAANYENMVKSKRLVSDHLPVWAVFHVMASDDD